MSEWTLCECIFVTFQNLKKNIKNISKNVTKNVLKCEEKKIYIKILVYYLTSAKKKSKMAKKNTQKKKIPSPEMYQMLIYSHICLLFYQFSNLQTN